MTNVLYLFLWGMTETKGSILRFCIAYALRNVKLQVGKRFLKPDLTEAQRYEVAEVTIREMRKFGGWKDLDDPVEPVQPGPRWIDGKPPGP